MQFFKNIKTLLIQNWLFALINFGITTLLTLYLLARYSYLNDMIPFDYTKPWGAAQLAQKVSVFQIPMWTLCLTLISLIIVYQISKGFYPHLREITTTTITLANLGLALSALRIVFKASTPFPPLVDPLFLGLTSAFIITFIMAYLIAPKVISNLRDKGIVTNPKLHEHPAMLLKEPSTRGGSLIFTLAVIATGLFFIELTTTLAVIYLTLALLTALGILDDYQNSNKNSVLSFLENPAVRLISLILIILVPVLAGIQITSVANLFSNSETITALTTSLASGEQIAWGAVLISAIWITWVMTTLSWSNGVDGQFSGIMGVAFLMTAVLALRFAEPTQTHIQMAYLSSIAAGASWGLVKYNWYPSKIMWGFGAMAAGFVLAATAIIIGSKVAVSIIIILVPFLDALVTFARRIIQKKNPLKGDSGHLHHLLIERGWGIRRVAVFYWGTTAIFGAIAILAADKNTLLVTLTLGGAVAALIIALNLSRKVQLKLPRLRSE